jgi:hypothetical protein
MWKEKAAACFKILSWYLLIANKENYGIHCLSKSRESSPKISNAPSLKETFRSLLQKI